MVIGCLRQIGGVVQLIHFLLLGRFGVLLWIGTIQGSVLVIVINFVAPGEPRQSLNLEILAIVCLREHLPSQRLHAVRGVH